MLEYFSKLMQPLEPTGQKVAAGARWGSHLPSASSRARNTNRRAGPETFLSCPNVCHHFVLQLSVSGGVWHSLPPSKAIAQVQELWLAPPLCSAPAVLLDDRARVVLSQTSGTIREQGGLQMVLMLRAH